MLPKTPQQGVSLGLYVIFGVLAAFKKPFLLILLAFTHLAEYFIIGRKVAAENGIDQKDAYINTQLYGFTWWKPIRDGK